MTYAELQEFARRWCADFPDSSPETIFINGFIQGYRQAGKEVSDEDEKPERFTVDYEEVKTLYNTICVSYPTLRALTDARKRKVRERAEEMVKIGDWMAVLHVTFDKMQASSFLRGENKRHWTATFDWLFKNGSNWAKVYEGYYDNTRSGEPETDSKSVNDIWDD